MSHPAIRVENVSKRFRIGAGKQAYRTLRESISETMSGAFRRGGVPGDQSRELWALKDVSFDVAPGEVLGIIGRNGAGKSTLLKVLSRITRPTTGQVRVRGRVASLLEVGTGFHQELTGRENVYLNGTILGMSRREIDLKFDDIVAFAEIDRFIDTAVKRYSSGMYLRLAFAVAAHLEPEILVIDEVLAVGDHAFQSKCMRKMQEVGRSGRTVLFVSHNMAAVGALCSRAVWIHAGRRIDEGPAARVLERYVSSSAACEGEADLSAHGGRWAGKQQLIRAVRCLNASGALTGATPIGGTLHLQVDVDVPGGHGQVELWAGIQDSMGDRIASISSAFQPGGLQSQAGTVTVNCRVPRLPFVPDRYYLTLWVVAGGLKLDVVENALAFDVVPADFFGSGRLPEGAGRGRVLLESEWRTAAVGDSFR